MKIISSISAKIIQTVLLTILILSFFTFSVSAAAEYSFRWVMGADVVPVTFSLIFNEEPIVVGIRNETGRQDDVFLDVSSRNNQVNYQLIFFGDLPIGEHTWRIASYDENGTRISLSENNPINILETQSLDEILMGIVTIILASEVLFTTGSLISQLVLTVGFIAVLVFYGIIFFSNLILVGSIGKVLAALGIGKKKARDGGFVFDHKSYKGVPFALITVEGTSVEKKSITETMVTDVYGVYQAINMPPGDYKIRVEKTGFSFPVTQARPPYMQDRDFYKGESFRIGLGSDYSYINIPMEPELVLDGNQKNKRTWKNTLNLLVTSMQNALNRLNYWLLAIAIIGMVINPSALYGLAIAFYGFLSVRSWIKIGKKNTIKGVVVDEQGKYLDHAVVNLYDIESRRLVTVTPVDSQGKFFFSVPIKQYQISVSVEGYVNLVDGKLSMSDQVITAGSKGVTVLTVRKFEQMSDDWLMTDSDNDQLQQPIDQQPPQSTS
jgi:hypothetical protein